MSNIKKVVFALAGFGLVASTAGMSTQPLRAGASLPSVTGAMLSAPGLSRVGAKMSPVSDARGKATGFGNYGVFILAGVVVIAIIVVVASSKNGRSPG